MAAMGRDGLPFETIRDFVNGYMRQNPPIGDELIRMLDDMVLRKIR